MLIMSIIADALHGLPTGKPKIKSERHYYTSNKLFEQSLDLYRPPAKKNTSKDAASSSEPPIVALVVGSAWLGHRAWIYLQTSWWNSSGPKAVAELGYVCVCIRHRGSFMKTWTLLTLTFVVVMAALITALINAVVDDAVWELFEEAVGEKIFLGRQAGGFLIALAGLVVMMELGGHGAANFDDMQNDVLDALAWLQANEDRLGLKRTTAPNERNSDGKSTQKRLFIFGGYSSGGHVAATVTQRPELWEDKNLPPPHRHCDSILYISPVLSTTSYHEILSEKVSDLSRPSSMPSLASSDGSSTEHLSAHSSIATEESSFPKSTPPSWLTDQVVTAVFGHEMAPTVPSPIHTCERSPPIPHLFVGCKNEMFGLSWLDTFFCSPSYCELLNSFGIESRYTAVQSDHWNILASEGLSNALRKELEWIEVECGKSKQ